MHRTAKSLLALTIPLLVYALAWAEEQPASRPTADTLFSAEAYIAHVAYLASDELGGRGPATEGSEKAARYIVEQFEQAGCQPGGEDGTWFQPFEVRRGKRLVDEEAALEISGLDRQCELRKDWIPLPFTETEDVEGPLAFAGYGIQATNFEYDDYDGFDAEGKILLIFRYEPKDEDPEAKFGGERPSRHALFVRKARTAANQGAKALLIVNPPNRDPDKDQLYDFDASNSQQTYQLPMAHITREMAGAILEKAGAPDLKTLQEKLDEERKPLSQDLGLTVALRPGVKPNMLLAKNVLGVIRGDGGTEETIVVGAHRDHLGIQPPRSRGADRTPVVYNGADDNASGTAGVIELARAVNSGPPLRRNVLFIAFDAEEMGLLGSRHFVGNPTVELDNVRAMLNLDMVGRLSQKKFTIFGIPTAEEFPELVEKAAEERGLKYKASRGMFGGSDHASFARHDIPALFFFTGMHKEYHQPQDDWELIDAEGATKILELSYDILVHLADMEEGPTFTEPSAEPDEEEPAKKPAAEEEKEAREAEEAGDDAPEDTDEPPSRGDMRVRLGVMPDVVGDDQPGMLVETVLDGGAAKAAGMQDGDRILKIGDEDVRDIYAYMRAMQQFKPGDVVEVLIVRNGEKKTLKVKLQASRSRRGRE